MTPKIPTLVAFALLVFACSRSGKMQRDQKQYDVVPEGSASGVTSTINGPGETTAPLTNTNLDTTTTTTETETTTTATTTAPNTKKKSDEDQPPPLSPPPPPPPTDTTDTRG